MNWNSIRTKVLALLVCGLAAGVGGTLTLLRYSFAKNSQALASESVGNAQRLFGILEAREISKMSVVGETLVLNPEVLDAFAARDRGRLLALNAPLYLKLRAEGITNWMFHVPEPDMVVFLRLHAPANHGDRLNRFIDREVARTHSLVAGNELAKAGFAVRIIRPVFDLHGSLIGYVELGEEIGRFIREMKKETGDDYGLLLSKKFLNRRFWADTSATLKRRDNWNDNPGFVVADKTTASEGIIHFQGDLATVAGQGKVLERFRDGTSVFVRGIFPIPDAGGNTVGAVFVVHDISGVYLSMRDTQDILVLLSIGGLVIGGVLLLTLLNRMIFRRLEHIIRVATRVVGGDYQSVIQIRSDDEIGRFEQLFEQFRCVFVNLLANLTELEEKN
jgi:hypothetical protein